MKTKSVTLSFGMKSLLCLMFGVCLLGARPAAAQVLVMKLDNIPGEVQLAGFTDYININSFSLGHSRSVSSPVGGGGNREGSVPSFSEITITKPMDKTSVLLADQGSVGTGIANGHITVLRNKVSGGGMEEAYEVGFKNAIVSGYSVSGASGETPTESISLNFTAVSWTYFPPSVTNTTPVTKSYDLVTATGGTEKY